MIYERVRKNFNMRLNTVNLHLRVNRVVKTLLFPSCNLTSDDKDHQRWQRPFTNGKLGRRPS